MSMEHDDHTYAVVDHLSRLIVKHASMTAREQYNPGGIPDESDDYIKEHKEYVKKLRQIREQFEDLLTGVLP